MSDSRLDPSDAQISRHAMGQIAEQAAIMRQCLVEQAFIGQQLEQLLAIWWEVTLKHAMEPNMSQLMDSLSQIMGHTDDEED